MTDEEFKTLVAKSKARFDALTPEQQKVEMDAQRDSWVRGEMALSKLVKKRWVNGVLVYDDYESYCLD